MDDDLTAWRTLQDLDARLAEAVHRPPSRAVVDLLTEAHRIAGGLGDEARCDLYGFGLGVELCRSAAFAEASRWIEPAPEALLRLGIAPAAAHLWRARCRLRTGRDKEAVADFEAAVAFGLDEIDCVTVVEARGELADVLLLGGDPADRLRITELLTAAAEQWELLGDRDAWRVTRTKLGRRRGLRRFVERWDHGLRLAAAIDEVMAAKHAGDTDRARWLLANMVVGAEAVPQEVFRLRLVFNLADLVAEVAVLRGEFGQAMAAVRPALARWHPELSRRGLAPDAAKAFARYAGLSYLLGDDRAGDAASARAEELVDTTDDLRASLLIRLMIAKARSGEPAVETLREIAAIAGEYRLADVQIEAWLGVAAEADARGQLAALDEVEARLPALDAGWQKRGRYRAEAIPQIQALMTVTRVTALAELDPPRARALLDAGNLESMGAHAAQVRFAVDAAQGSPDARLSVMDGARAIIAQVEAAALEGQREWAFRRLRDGWAVALDTLAGIGDHAAATVALHLVELGNRGTMTAFAHRGASAGITLDVAAGTGDVASRLGDAARLLSTMGAVPVQQPPELAGRPALAFGITEREPGVRLRGVRILIDDRARASIARIEISGDALNLLEKPREELYQVRPDNPSWTALSRQLLGGLDLPAAAGEQPATLLIAPGDPVLAGLPWSACRTGPGEMLIHRFAVQIVPALSLLTGPRAVAGTEGRALVYTVEQVAGEGGGPLDTSAERAAWAGQDRWPTFPHDLDRRLTADEFAEALRLRGQWAVAYIASHGTGHGLDDGLVHADGSVLTVRDALGLWWPELVILSSCHVGAMEPAPGADPLGLPLACLLRGASFVIGCNESITDRGAATIGAALAENLASASEPPALVLRAAQLRWLAHRARGPLRTWAPYQIISFC